MHVINELENVMKKIIALLAAVVVSQYAVAENIPVESDPRAKYSVVEIVGSPEKLFVTSKRVGPSGTSFAKREVNCLTRQFMYLAEGDTWDEFKSSKPAPNTKMTNLTKRSISSHVSAFACKKVNVRFDPWALD